MYYDKPMYAVIKNQHHQKMILLIAALAIFMNGLDGSIVNVALPVIAGDFGVDISGSSWVVMAYLLIMAGFILAFGKIADQGVSGGSSRSGSRCLRLARLSVLCRPLCRA